MARSGHAVSTVAATDAPVASVLHLCPAIRRDALTGSQRVSPARRQACVRRPTATTVCAGRRSSHKARLPFPQPKSLPLVCPCPSPLCRRHTCPYLHASTRCKPQRHRGPFFVASPPHVATVQFSLFWSSSSPRDPLPVFVAVAALLPAVSPSWVKRFRSPWLRRCVTPCPG